MQIGKSCSNCGQKSLTVEISSEKMMVPRKSKGQNENSMYSSPGSKIKTSSTVMHEEMRAATSRFCRKCRCVGYTLKRMPRDWTHAHDRKAREKEKEKTHSVSQQKSQLIRCGDGEKQWIQPSTAAITTRNNAVSVAVVMLAKRQD